MIDDNLSENFAVLLAVHDRNGFADVRDRRAPGTDRVGRSRVRYRGLLSPDRCGRADRTAPDHGAAGARLGRDACSRTG